MLTEKRSKGVIMQKVDLKTIKSEVQGKAGQILDEIRGSAALTAAVGTQTLRLFALNQGTLGVYLTNQVGTNGQLPAPDEFLITGIKFSLIASNNMAPLFYDFIDIFNQATFEFAVSNRVEISGLLASFIPPQIVVPIDSKPEQTRCYNLASFVSLRNNPIKLDPSRQFDMKVDVNKVISVVGNAYGAAGYAANYTVLYMMCQLTGLRQRAVK